MAKNWGQRVGAEENLQMDDKTMDTLFKGDGEKADLGPSSGKPIHIEEVLSLEHSNPLEKLLNQTGLFDEAPIGSGTVNAPQEAVIYQPTAVAALPAMVMETHVEIA